ncbi:hypothetical protein Hbl1158_14995 (plasmid) [Halobaculum sp. CBA1158]|uniref:hypothetical protein n=1 Tax=Halobaculum sp. CBA1158 TaxID=2904243 RepID=UPI001F1F365A|nr:hypothetical protein [Halobaculum sp. CBA1158]UIP01444.1 hypothetical protein Hbl1158_14995 [Halobaculum sp. CBA1158]
MFDLPIGDDERNDGVDDGGADDVAGGLDGGANSGDGDDRFDPVDAFVSESLPDPGPFLADDGTTVLTGDDHVAVRDTARELFEERGVRDATFGYVLTKLDRDRNHPDAGFRYARDGADLRVEFTPTTGFCPQGGALATAALRAWNGDPAAHEFDHVAVRVSPTYHAAESVNDRLADAGAALRESGALPWDASDDRDDRGDGDNGAGDTDEADGGAGDDETGRVPARDGVSDP